LPHDIKEDLKESAGGNILLEIRELARKMGPKYDSKQALKI
jgi:hypothetical protein